MKICSIITAVVVLSFVAAANLNEGVRWVFEDAPAGKLPEGWSAAQTNKGAESAWRVIEDTSAKSGKQVLAQLGAYGPKAQFNLCVCDESNLKDVVFSKCGRRIVCTSGLPHFEKTPSRSSQTRTETD